MKNMKLEVRENKLIIEVDLEDRGTLTSRGNILLAGTSNWEKLDEVQAGLSINMAVVKSTKGAR